MKTNFPPTVPYEPGLLSRLEDPHFACWYVGSLVDEHDTNEQASRLLLAGIERILKVWGARLAKEHEDLMGDYP